MASPRRLAGPFALLVVSSLAAASAPEVAPRVQGPLAVTGEGLATSALIPGVANNPGQFFSYFTTDVTLMNPARLGRLALVLEALSGEGKIAGSKTLELAPGGFTTLRNVLFQMGVFGGHVLLVRVDPARSTADAASFAAWAATKTANPIGPGEYGVTLPVLAVVPLSAEVDGVTAGVEITAARRTNVGVINQSADTLTVTVRAVDASGATAGEKLFTLPGWGFAQLPLSNFVAGRLEEGAVLFVNGSGRYVGYVVVNDNSSNDAFFEVATPSP